MNKNKNNVYKKCIRNNGGKRSTEETYYKINFQKSIIKSWNFLYTFPTLYVDKTITISVNFCTSSFFFTGREAFTQVNSVYMTKIKYCTGNNVREIYFFVTGEGMRVITTEKRKDFFLRKKKSRRIQQIVTKHPSKKVPQERNFVFQKEIVNIMYNFHRYNPNIMEKFSRRFLVFSLSIPFTLLFNLFSFFSICWNIVSSVSVSPFITQSYFLLFTSGILFDLVTVEYFSFPRKYFPLNMPTIRKLTMISNKE